MFAELPGMCVVVVVGVVFFVFGLFSFFSFLIEVPCFFRANIRGFESTGAKFG